MQQEEIDPLDTNGMTGGIVGSVRELVESWAVLGVGVGNLGPRSATLESGQGRRGSHANDFTPFSSPFCSSSAHGSPCNHALAACESRRATRSSLSAFCHPDDTFLELRVILDGLCAWLCGSRRWSRKRAVT